jgi:HSP20 family molecular chaperone IbpA
MKKLITLIAAFFIVAAASQAQTLQGLFDKYADDERFEYVSVGKGMMNMASAFGGIAKNDKEMMSKMKGIKILTLNANSDSPLMKAIERDLSQVIEAGDFETAVEARDKGERVHIYYRVSGKDKADMLIVTKEKGELSLIWFTGKMTKEEMLNSFSSNGETMQTHSDFDKKSDSIS